MDIADIQPGTHVRYIPHADEMAAKGVDLSAARGTLTGTVVPFDGAARQEWDRLGREIRRSFKGEPDRRAQYEREARQIADGEVIAILRDDATPGHVYQFAAPGDLLPGVPNA